MTTPRYPFSAIVGHDELRLALLLTAVHPGIGGVLIRGEKGTAKSTVVRALSALLPAVTAVAGCRFSCAPQFPDVFCPDGPHTSASRTDIRPAKLVELPVGATEDRLVGSLDLQRALNEGVSAYQPGLLAAACCTSTRSTCWPITSLMCYSMPPRWAVPTSSVMACRFPTLLLSCWSGP
jgi:magnesium chelatase subunit D